MNNKKIITLDYFINITFLLYFVILITERMISLVKTILDKGWHLIYSGASLDSYMYTLIMISVFVFLIFFILRCRQSIQKIFQPNTEINFVSLSFASGILLLSGMVHTANGMPALQFTAYGILIVGMLLKAIQVSMTSKTKTYIFVSFLYIVCYSMTIPVVYSTKVSGNIILEAINCVGSLLLTFAFTYLLCLFYSPDVDAEIILSYVPFIFSILFDVVIIVWRWNEKENQDNNIFLLSFLIATVIIFIFSRIYVYRSRIKEMKKDS